MKSKWPEIKEKLILIQKWARDGLTEEQIGKNIGLSHNTFNEYKKKYPEFRDAVKKGKEVAITEIENALFKRALGYDYTEVKTYLRNDGDKVTEYTEKTVKHQPPDVAACSILLKNKDRGNWSDNPMKIELEREMMEFRKTIEENKNF